MISSTGKLEGRLSCPHSFRPTLISNQGEKASSWTQLGAAYRNNASKPTVMFLTSFGIDPFTLLSSSHQFHEGSQSKDHERLSLERRKHAEDGANPTDNCLFVWKSVNSLIFCRWMVLTQHRFFHVSLQIPTVNPPGQHPYNLPS